MFSSNPPSFLHRAVWILLLLLLLFVIYYLINIGNNYVSDNKKIKFNNKKILMILGSIILCYAFYSLSKKYNIISDTIYTIIISAIIAYLFNPIINYFESKKINRLWGVIIVYLVIIGVFFVLAFLIVPRSGSELKSLATNLPIYFEKVSDTVDKLYAKYYASTGDLPPVLIAIEEVVMENISIFEEMILNSIKVVISGIVNIFSKILSLILIPILTLYFLIDKDFFKNKLLSLIPKRYRNDTKTLCIQIDRFLSQFVRGRLILALYVGIATTILLLFLNVEFAIVIGFITGIADVVPYFGPFLGFLPSVFFAFLSRPIKALWTILFFILIQWVENNILAPKILGETTGIHPITILLSIIIGGGMFGVVGMIFSIPVVAISKILYGFFIEKIRKPPISDK